MSNNSKIMSFIVWIVLMGFGFAFILHYFNSAKQDKGIPKIGREIMAWNSSLFQRANDDTGYIKMFDFSEAKPARVNGNVGMRSSIDTNNYQVVVRFEDAKEDSIILDLDDIKALPYTNYTFLFKCVEGWSQKTNWGGIAFKNILPFLQSRTKHNLQSYEHLGFETPDRKYYVGIDFPSMLHPQTLFCFVLNKKPLPLNQGAPLRLLIPIKYGIKSLKRIKYMTFMHSQPKDYWCERGYDYNSGL